MASENLMLQSASTVAPIVDQTMWVLLLVCGGTLLLVFGLMLFFCARYRKGSPHSRVVKKQQSLALEIGWTAATLAIFLALFVWGMLVYFDMHVQPEQAIKISVIGKQWMWKIQHAGGQKEINELHIPINKPILLMMTSQDVIHSFFVPDFRVKQDVLPGRYTYVWFEASQVGEYQIFCTQYCGTMHAQMIGRVVVLSESDYEKWLEGAGAAERALESPSKRGEKLFTSLACSACHTGVDQAIGPNLHGIYGKKVHLDTGEEIVRDDEYIRESILYPNAKIVRGYKPLMPTYLGRVSEDDLLDLIAYIKSLTIAK